jgi:hypothetical protein
MTARSLRSLLPLAPLRRGGGLGGRPSVPVHSLSMNRLPRFLAALGMVAGLLLAAAAGRAATTFSVSFASDIRKDPATGRLVVWVSRGALGLPLSAPGDEIDEQDPQPIFGMDIANLRPGDVATVDDRADGFPAKLSQLPAGWYRAQAVLQVVHESSNWHHDVGNLFSETIRFQVGPTTQPVQISLNKVVLARTPPHVAGVEIVEVPSKLLSDFRGKPVRLRAGVVLPQHIDPKRKYPAVYEVPGFGGDHFGAFRHAVRMRQAPVGSPVRLLADDVFWIVLDPESPNGHTLFADSDNNGPVGTALVNELIPALEAKYPLIAERSARLLRGHSSGGWSTLWLMLNWPKVFGATWSSSPDPIDFHRFQLSDIYEWDNFYNHDGRELPSARFGGRETMTVRQENAIEAVIGPYLTSGQQWASWQAVAGHRLPNGGVKPLYDPATGAIDREEAKSYERYDIDQLLRSRPAWYGKLWRRHVRLLVGDQDTYYLNEAVKLLQIDLDRLAPVETTQPTGGATTQATKWDFSADPDVDWSDWNRTLDVGYIKIVPGADHGSIYGSPQMLDIPREMAEYLRIGGHIPTTTPATTPATQP